MPLEKKPNSEPIRGYHPFEPLGHGGFGEVWKCEAPGGVFKAIKFVGAGLDGATAARQELAALERVKTLRHPFVLSLDRIEESNGELLVIMELADQSLFGLFTQYRDCGQHGVPREDLLG